MPRNLGMGWHTTNGFDVTFYLSNGEQFDVTEQIDGNWHCEHWVEGNAEYSTHPSRSEAVAVVREYLTAHAPLRAVPSDAQRAAGWFKGENSDDYQREDKKRKPQFHPEAVAAPPQVDPLAALKMLDAMQAAAKLDALMRGIK